MKYLLIIIIFTIGFGLLGFWAWRQTIKEMQVCADASTKNIQADLNWLLATKPDKAALCERSTSQYQALNTCYQNITRHYFIPTAWVEPVILKSFPNFPSLVRNRAFLARACPPSL